MSALPWFCLILIVHKLVAIDIDDITLSNCTSKSSCVDVDIDVSNAIANVSTSSENVNNGDTTPPPIENSTNINATTSTPQIIRQDTTSMIAITTSTVKPASNSNIENTTISQCDSDCCCAADCKGIGMSTSTNHRHPHSQLYNFRYCYTKNYIFRNNTRFTLERLGSNMFCIAYDNLPPMYGLEETLVVKDKASFKDAKSATHLKQKTWSWDDVIISPKFNMLSQYQSMDDLWKFQNNMVTPIEFPQSGFTGECRLRKSLKYRETSKWSCMQTDLSNDNTFLFGKAYENFSVIASPYNFNLSLATAENYTCPKNVCVPVKSFYCANSSSLCNETKTPRQLCSNGSCQNVVKHVLYIITLNRVCNIETVEIRFRLTNTSHNFYQNFEVIFKSVHEPPGVIFSGNDGPGYKIGKPIIVGTLVQNNTNNVITSSINVSDSCKHLTVPFSRRNGDCDPHERYVVGFGEDVRLRCSVALRINNFSSNSCIDLQNQTLHHLLDASLHQVAEIDKYNIFVSKTGNISDKVPLNWTQVLLDRIAENVVTGQIHDNRIHCSGLLTSMSIEILYTILPKSEASDFYKVVGVSAEFLPAKDMTWPKCVGVNCTDFLNITLLSFVTFTDVSTPSMYYYAGGTNFDITLPYDFFYPFMSSACSIESSLLIQLIGFIVIFISFDL